MTTAFKYFLAGAIAFLLLLLIGIISATEVGYDVYLFGLYCLILLAALLLNGRLAMFFRCIVATSVCIFAVFGFWGQLMSSAHLLSLRSTYSLLYAILFAIFVGLPLVLYIKKVKFGFVAQIPTSDSNTESAFVVKTTEESISVSNPYGTQSDLLKSNLREFFVVTDDSGPWGEDVWWVLVGETPEASCYFPNGATGAMEVLQYLETLPGFKNDVFIQAMGSTSNAKFICWTANDRSQIN